MKKRRLTSERGHTAQFPYIPQEIFEEILSRLPIMTLLRLKSVCRSWNTLISDQNFSKLHLQQSNNQNRTNFVFLHNSYGTLAYAAPDYHGASKINKRLRDEHETTNASIDILASCNGLFCVNNVDDDLFLFNRSTREARKIPISVIEFPSKSSCTWALVFYGLGYHSACDDYKLVRVSMFDSIDFQTEVQMFSRNTGTWKRIGDFPYDFPRGGPGLFVSGSLHWIVSLWADDWVRCYMVAAINLDSEHYDLIKLPKFGCEVSYFEICTLEENLVLFCGTGELTLEMWILKEYGKPESWTRIKIAIPSTTSIEEYVYLQPLCVWKPGEILLRVDYEKFVIYDVKKKVGVDVLISHKIMTSRVISIVESLESPYAPKHILNKS